MLLASYTYVDAKTNNQFFDANFGFTVEAGSSLLYIPEQQLSLLLVKSSKLNGNAFTYGGGLYMLMNVMAFLALTLHFLAFWSPNG